jgi:cytochrome c-type biogenesis protein
MESYFFAFIAGAAAFLSPCIIPMISVYLSLITGMTLDELISLDNKKAIRTDILVNTLLFVVGFGLIFTLAGGTAALIGSFFQYYLRVMEITGGIFVIWFGLKLTGLFKLNLLAKFSLNPRASLPKKPVGNLGAFSVGVFFAIVCSHCIGPLLYSLLIYVGAKGTPNQGMLSLALFSLGLAIPYLITAFAISSALDYLEKFKKYLWLVSVASGLLLVFFGILMLTGNFLKLSELVSKIMPFKIPGM